MSGSVDFLVIGAEKCGTTTLYEDLRCHPEIHVPDKESSLLLGNELTPKELRTRYSDFFGPRSVRSQLFGEVATTYTMLPEHPEAPEHAIQVAPDAKIIYIVREPISRVISHHHQDYGLGLVGPDINKAVREHAPLIDNSCYATQLEPWLDRYGHDRTRVVRMEDYTTDRSAGHAALLGFLGVDTVPLADTETVHNAASTKTIATGLWSRISQNSQYRNRIRPLLPESARRWLVRSVLPKAPPRPAPPQQDALRYLVDRLSGEVEALAELMHTEPWWDLNAAASAHAAPDT